MLQCKRIPKKCCISLQSDHKALSSSTVGSNGESAEFSGSTAAATAASALSGYANPAAETEEDAAVKSFGKNPHPYHTPARPQDEEEERMPLDLFMC